MPIINPLPNTIVNGAPLDATPLMANFNAIVSNVNAGAAGLTVANTFSVVQTFNGIYNNGAYVNQTTGVSQSSIFTDAAGNLVIGTGLNATPAYARHNADGSLTLPAGLSATTGTFSSTLNVSGATTLAGLSATTGTFSNNVTFSGVSNAFNAANVGIEIGSLSVANAPYLDFHSSGNAIDYDARILASGGNIGVGNGALTYSAYGGHLFNGGVVMSNGLTVNNTANALVKSVGLGGYGGFWAEGSGTNNAYLLFANTANGERYRITSDAGRNLYFSGDGGVSSHFTIFSNGDISPLGNMMSAQVNGAWDGAFRALTVRSAASSGTVANFGLLRQSLYGLDVGLDSDNGFKIGGWSQGTGVFRFTLDTAGNGVFTGNVTAYSDGRDKQDWKPLVGIKQHLLGLKNWGAYTDIRSGERKVGVVAQDFLRAMPEAVLTDESTGRYSFAYGQAAMAALVAYAHDNETDLNVLRSEVAAIKAELGAHHG